MVILIVDDSVIYRHLLANTLNEWGYLTFEAENGQVALNIIEQHSINIVISNWEMPIMNGLDLCQNIRNLNCQHYIYLLLISIRQSIDDHITCIESGADDFLSKPINYGELHARLHAAERILLLEANLLQRNIKLTAAYQQIESGLQAAARLQKNTLPVNYHKIKGFKASWLFLPSAYVSGDVLNYFQLGQHYLGFYSIDVAGHGVSAAMLSLTIARQFLTGRLVDHLLLDKNSGSVVDPSLVVTELNRRFCLENEDVNSYFTMVYGVIDTRDGNGQLCQAGHPTPFIIRAINGIEPVGTGGIPVGLFPDSEYQDSMFHLAEKDRLCLFSDGISECDNAEFEQYGESRLHLLVLENNHQSDDVIFSQLETSLKQWRGIALDNEDELGCQVFVDDVSILMIQREN